MNELVPFRYILKSNQDVEISGTVCIPLNEDADDSEFEIVFDGQGQLPTPNLFIHHYGVEITGITDEQDREINRLKELFMEDFQFFVRICDYADGNTALDLGEVYMVINDCDYREKFDL